MYYENKMKASVQSHAFLSIIIDGMDQGKTYLPVVPRRQKNDDVTFIKQKIMGVKVSLFVDVAVNCCFI